MNEPIEISFDDSWFITDTSTSLENSDEYCLTLDYDLFMGEDCSNVVDSSEFSLDEVTKTITVHASSSYQD
jgi:hypothetical protein